MVSSLVSLVVIAVLTLQVVLSKDAPTKEKKAARGSYGALLLKQVEPEWSNSFASGSQNPYLKLFRTSNANRQSSMKPLRRLTGKRGSVIPADIVALENWMNIGKRGRGAGDCRFDLMGGCSPWRVTRGDESWNRYHHVKVPMGWFPIQQKKSQPFDPLSGNTVGKRAAFLLDPLRGGSIGKKALGLDPLLGNTMGKKAALFDALNGGSVGKRGMLLDPLLGGTVGKRGLFFDPLNGGTIGKRGMLLDPLLGGTVGKRGLFFDPLSGRTIGKRGVFIDPLSQYMMSKRSFLDPMMGNTMGKRFFGSAKMLLAGHPRYDYEAKNEKRSSAVDFSMLDNLMKVGKKNDLNAECTFDVLEGCNPIGKRNAN